MNAVRPFRHHTNRGAEEAILRKGNEGSDTPLFELLIDGLRYDGSVGICGAVIRASYAMWWTRVANPRTKLCDPTEIVDEVLIRIILEQATDVFWMERNVRQWLGDGCEGWEW